MYRVDRTGSDAEVCTKSLILDVSALLCPVLFLSTLIRCVCDSEPISVSHSLCSHAEMALLWCCSLYNITHSWCFCSALSCPVLEHTHRCEMVLQWCWSRLPRVRRRAVVLCQPALCWSGGTTPYLTGTTSCSVSPMTWSSRAPSTWSACHLALFLHMNGAHMFCYQ